MLSSPREPPSTPRLRRARGAVVVAAASQSPGGPDAQLEVFHGHAALGRALRAPVIAIGNFDGVHRGHQRLFEETRRLAAASGGESVVLTFSPHPARVLAPAYAPPLITTEARKLELIGEAGLAVAVVEPFDAAFAALSAEDFFARVLDGGLGARHICVGHDFTFGKGRSGDTARLAELGAARGIGVHVIPPFAVDGLVCSSTKVREFVLAGRIDGAALLLGRPFELDGIVVHGDGRGAKIGFPTANLAPATELLPATGVYAGSVVVDGREVAAAINVGRLPTISDGRPITVEAHLCDWSGDLYDRPLRLAFRERLRAEARFASLDELVAQIGRDVEQTRQLHAARRATQPSPNPSAHR